MTDASYAQLLEDLRRDLQLNPSTDLLPFALASAQNQPWKIDVGTGAVVFSGSAGSANTTVAHRLGRTPIFVGAFNNTNNGIWFTSGLWSASGATVHAEYTSALTGTFTFSWVAIG